MVGGTTCCPYHEFNEAETYDPVSQTWTPTSTKMTNANKATILLPDGLGACGGRGEGHSADYVNVATQSYSTPLREHGRLQRACRPIGLIIHLHCLRVVKPGCRRFQWRLGCLQRSYQRRAIRFERRHVVSYGQHDRRPVIPHGDNPAEWTSPRGWGQDCEGNILSSAELNTPPNGGSTCLSTSSRPRQLVVGRQDSAEDVQGTNNRRPVRMEHHLRKGMVGPGIQL